MRKVRKVSPAGGSYGLLAHSPDAARMARTGATVAVMPVGQRPQKGRTQDTLTAWSCSARDTQELGGSLASLIEAGDLILLGGDLGAGKTTLTQGLAKGLGVPGPVTSPTFVLQRIYPCNPQVSSRPPTALVHADVYRLERLGEVVDLDMADLLEDGAAAVVEWGEVAAKVLPYDHLLVRMELGPCELQRIVTFEVCGQLWEDRRQRLAKVISRWRSQC